MDFISREEWGARPPTGRTGFTPSGGSTVHWEGPGLGNFAHSRCYSFLRGIQDYHMDARGWADIAYTAVVCPHGYTFEGRWIGARTGANGTNAGNNAWYAICALVGVGDATPEAMVQEIHETADFLRDNGRAGPRVNGHRDHKSTMCPGDTLYGIVRSGRFETEPGGSPAPSPGEGINMEDKEVNERFDRLERAINATRGDVWKTAEMVEQKYGSLRGWAAAIGLTLIGKATPKSFNELRHLAYQNDPVGGPDKDK